MGRFMTPDWAARPTAVPYAVFGDPQTLNLYTYVENNPINRADADGHQDETGGNPASVCLVSSPCETKISLAQKDAANQTAAQNSCCFWDIPALNGIGKEIGNEIAGLFNLGNDIASSLSSQPSNVSNMPEVQPNSAGESAAMKVTALALFVVPGESEVKLTSSIGKDAKLVRFAEEAGGSVQKGLDHLVGELGKGNTNPGLGTKSLGEGISYARARDGARVFFRQAGEQIEILAKASKANEAKVINYLKSLY